MTWSIVHLQDLYLKSDVPSGRKKQQALFIATISHSMCLPFLQFSISCLATESEEKEALCIRSH